MERHSPQDVERYVLSLETCDGETPPGLVELLKQRIDEVQAEAPTPPATIEFRPPAPEERNSKAVQVEARLFHAIDEEAAENPQRVAQREEARSGLDATTVAAQQVASTQAALEAQVRRLQRMGIGLNIQVEELATVS